MNNLLAIPILGFVVILQTTILSRVPLLQGPADLLLLTLVCWVFQARVTQSIWIWPVAGGLLLGLFSHLPIWLPVIAYGIVTGLTLALKRRVWQIPVLALFTSVFLGTIVTNAVSFLYLIVQGVPLVFLEAVNIILLPSIILNLILAIPVQAVINEIGRWSIPVEAEAEA
ncbi:MAG TPA: hypothetical protein VJ768_09120 [Anaerolineales bacterium]|nr:hypothetical protein [Anaerolineales bacterium]